MAEGLAERGQVKRRSPLTQLASGRQHGVHGEKVEATEANHRFTVCPSTHATCPSWAPPAVALIGGPRGPALLKQETKQHQECQAPREGGSPEAQGPRSPGKLGAEHLPSSSRDTARLRSCQDESRNGLREPGQPQTVGLKIGCRAERGDSAGVTVARPQGAAPPGIWPGTPVGERGPTGSCVSVCVCACACACVCVQARPPGGEAPRRTGSQWTVRRPVSLLQKVMKAEKPRASYLRWQRCSQKQNDLKG